MLTSKKLSKHSDPTSPMRLPNSQNLLMLDVRFEAYRGPTSHFARGIEGQTADRDQFHFTEVILESMPATRQECASILAPMLDQLANASGRVSADWLQDAKNFSL